VSGASVLGACHAWLWLRAGTGAPGASGLALEILFLCAVALDFGDGR
jgi:hypothetical protein